MTSMEQQKVGDFIDMQDMMIQDIERYVGKTKNKVIYVDSLVEHKLDEFELGRRCPLVPN
jgi:hypothetical protein